MKTRNIITSAIIFILCFLGSYKLIIPSRCYGMADGLWLILASAILLFFVSILFIHDLYKKIKFNHRINSLPYLTLLISISIITLIIYTKSEKFKSRRVLTGHNGYQELVLRENKNYELTHKLPEMGCTERGQYKISNDTVYLTEEPEITQTLYVNERYLIDDKGKQLILIKNDSLNSNKDDNLIIEKNYAP